MSTTVHPAPGIISAANAGDSVEMMRVSKEGVPSCMKCGETIDGAQKYFNFHDRCLTCPTCDEEMLVTYRDGPAETFCRSCSYRERAEREAAESALEHQKLEAATALLMTGPGTKEEREAAIEVVADYHYGLGCN